MASDNATAHTAANYDRDVRSVIPFYDLFHGETLDLVRAAKPDPRVWLDTGCGTGTLIEKALPLFPRTEFLLADPSDKMLGQARARLVSAAPGRVRLLATTGSGELPAHVSVQPDVLTAIQCHHYLNADGRRAAVKACFDVLAAGGLFVTFENVRPLTTRGLEIGFARWRGFQMAHGRTSEQADAHLKRFDSEYFPITAVEHLALLRECGFCAAEVFWYSQMQAGFYAVK
jgi:tRNA (cmo5U34)-methyltransferase